MTTTKKQTQNRVDVYQKVTDKIINLLEQGDIVWKKSWSDYGLARNHVTGNTYKGINFLILNFCSPHEAPIFMTFNQVRKSGGKIRKGAKSLPVIYYNMVFKDENGKRISKEDAAIIQSRKKDVKTFKYVKYYNVFNIDDIEGIEFVLPHVELKENDILQTCEDVVSNMPQKPEIKIGRSNRAYYNWTSDFVNMPTIEQFTSSQHYYSVLFHELIHSTGHHKRLGRVSNEDIQKGFDSKPYSQEELVAELGAAFLCSITKTDRPDVVENSAAYIKGWLEALKNDKQLIFKAAADAQKAVDYILPEGH